MRVYLLALLISATVAYLMTPLARWCALRWGAITAVRDRDVHAIPTPRLGGMAMFAGILVAILMASGLPFLESVYANPRPLVGIVGGAAIVCALGVADDIWDLDWLTKLMGQVLAGGFLAWQGVLLYQLPTGGRADRSGPPGCGTFLTVLTVVIAMNAVNFVDGLDGLAAGVLAIGGTAFFLYAYLLTAGANPGAYANANLAALVLAVLVGACVGFLPHNVYPARIFMGDSGAMVLGLRVQRRGDRRHRPDRPGAGARAPAVPRVPADAPAVRGAAAAAARHGARDRPPGRRRQVPVPPRPHAPAPPHAAAGPLAPPRGRDHVRLDRGVRLRGRRPGPVGDHRRAHHVRRRRRSSPPC